MTLKNSRRAETITLYRIYLINSIRELDEGRKEQMSEKLAYRVTEAAEALGISRAKAYELIASGNIPSVRVGASIRVPVAALRSWIEEHTSKAAEAA